MKLLIQFYIHVLSSAYIGLTTTVSVETGSFSAESFHKNPERYIRHLENTDGHVLADAEETLLKHILGRNCETNISLVNLARLTQSPSSVVRDRAFQLLYQRIGADDLSDQSFAEQIKKTVSLLEGTITSWSLDNETTSFQARRVKV